MDQQTQPKSLVDDLGGYIAMVCTVFAGIASIFDKAQEAYRGALIAWPILAPLFSIAGVAFLASAFFSFFIVFVIMRIFSNVDDQALRKRFKLALVPIFILEFFFAAREQLVDRPVIDPGTQSFFQIVGACVIAYAGFSAYRLYKSRA